jgi:3-hydroxyacyl-CoA dehydrogenase/enoyl-CoA hydratase/3-hydroxybutyryl-CoA epimerase
MQAVEETTETGQDADTAAEKNIRLEELEAGVVLIVFDKQGSSANTFNHATIEEFDALIDHLADRPDIHGVIVTSAKNSIFVAGADIKELFRPGLSENDVRELVRLGQGMFNKLASLDLVSVAAIHGAALGGGCELALACDYRIASDSKSTKLGLPETMLGILPAWGGCTRLPRLVGLPTALDLILTGRAYPARKAKKAGLIDEVVPRERLIESARRLIFAGAPTRRKSHVSVNNPLSRAVISQQARKKLMAKTRGHYPSMFRALDVVSAGLGLSPTRSMRLEEDAFAEVSRKKTCHNLVQVFHLEERSKRFTVQLPAGETRDDRVITNIAVIGAGVMGAGIAQWSSARGQDVILKDISTDALAKGMQTIGHVYSEAVKRRIFTRREAQAGMDRVFCTTEDVPLRSVDLVIEAAVEKMELKKKIFQSLAAQVEEETILASNTSALSITELSESVRHPERVVGIHYFNPVHRMQLVEIVKGRHTSASTVDRAVRFAQGVGKLPVVVKDSPGFIVNRILMPYLAEAGALFASGAPPRELDRAMLDFGMPMGPVRLTDEVGIDVCAHVARHQAEHFGDRMPVPDVLDRMVESGFLGKKSGAGFYEYGHKKARLNPGVAPFVQSHERRSLSRADMAERMVLLMVNESARCIEEDLVAGPEDVDYAMIRGTGFAPFRGGPLRYADERGAADISNALRSLADGGELQFEPCDLLCSMAGDGRTFYDKKRGAA